MCGIVSIYAYRDGAPAIDKEELRLIRDAMKNRGPDGSGEWFSKAGKVGMGHRRLSIIDLSPAGAQPMTSADGRLVVTFNGEIYNYREIRERLEKKGKVFRSRSDTEVLLHLYEEKGEEMVEELRGMFAFALWDEKKQGLLLARDPYGIKPLYYADDGGTVRIASQVKALLAGGKISKVTDPAGVAGFFLFGSVPEPFTLYKEIRSVPAGSTLWISKEGISAPRSYFSISGVFKAANVILSPSARVILSGAKNLRASRVNSAKDLPPHSLAEDPSPLGLRPRDNLWNPIKSWRLRRQGSACGLRMTLKHEIQERVREALLDSVRHHFVSDVPVGIFLSSGIDSGALAGLARDAVIRDLRTLTLSFEEFKDTDSDEAPLAEKIAGLYGTKHSEHHLTESEFKAELPKVLAAMDQPTIDGINTYFVSKAAHEAGLKVALSGLGGDEIFGGYSSFHEIPALVRALAIPSRIPLLPHLFRNFCSPFVHAAGISPKAAGLLEFGGNYPGAYFLRRGLFMPWELKDVMDKDMAAEGLRQLSPVPYLEGMLDSHSLGPRAKIATLESSVYMRHQLLRDADWAGMAHSLEIRTPYADVCLLKSLAPLITSRKTQIEKNLLAGSPAVPLPSAVTRRKKTGFTVPIDKWLETDSKLDAWRRIPALATRSTHWSRRWAYTVYQQATAN